jgi:signal transduction histidine kinase
VTATSLNSNLREGGNVPVTNLLPPARFAEDLASVGTSATAFLAIVAHEMRQPLNAGVAALQVLRSATGTNGRERACQVIERQLARLSRLVEDLLDTSRLDLGMARLRKARIDLCCLIEEMAQTVRPQTDDKHQLLQVDVPANPVWVEADARICQVLSNLLLNAIQYTPASGRIAVAVRQSPDRGVLTVRDTGCGISPAVLPHVFEPFQRGHTVERTGLGLGLAIARQLVELHGGSIGVTSGSPGGGTEFTVSLPMLDRLERAGT